VAPELRDANVKAAPYDPSDLRFPINLATALRLSDARPLIVAAAQASVWVAEAQLTRAKVLWVPILNLGFDYIRHDGGGPDFNKGIMTAPSVNFFYGGAGMFQNVALSDVIFQPLAARQMLNARNWDIQTAKNDALLQTADAYFMVHQWRGMYAGVLYCVERGHDLVDRIAQLSRELVPTVEVDRARNLVADLEQRATSAREEWRVHSADLTQVLRLDPRAVVEPLEHDHLQITLIDPGRSLDELIPIGLLNRPELASQQAIVRAVLADLRREKIRPLVPSILINGFQTPNEELQAGIFGLGPNTSMNQWTGRVDLSYQPLWQLEAFGIGNLARIKEQRGEQSKAVIELFKTQDRVAADVTRALARLQSATARVGQADRALRTAIITFNGNFEGLRQTTRFGDVLVLVYRPQEVVFALQLMKLAFDEYFTTVAEYNRAQFQMFHALGYPAREVAEFRPPGEVLQIDTTRPGYLPPVGNGPPPATR
jgi:outer membrane protein TolC